MKKYRVERRGATQSQGSIKEIIEPVTDSSSVDLPGVFIFPNRREIEVGVSVITSGSASTSEFVFTDDDFGNEGFINQVVSSQTGLQIFQETRVLSQKELRRRAMEAIKKAEERRIKHQSILEDEIDI